MFWVIIRTSHVLLNGSVFIIKDKTEIDINGPDLLLRTQETSVQSVM